MFGQFGSSISEALSTEFFQWFRLEKTAESRKGDLTNRSYRPTAQQFHDLIEVTLTADPTERLRSVQMSIRRSFIDNPHHFTMAADISKSFLQAALESSDLAILHDAMIRIRH